MNSITHLLNLCTVDRQTTDAERGIESRLSSDRTTNEITSPWGTRIHKCYSISIDIILIGIRVS